MFLGQRVDPTTCLVILSETLVSVGNLESVLKTLDSCVVCIGYQDEKFSHLVKSHKGVFMGATGKTWCVCDGTDIIIVSFLSLHIGTCVTASADASTNPPTTCHARCAQLLTEGEMKHCGACTSYRKPSMPCCHDAGPVQQVK